MLRAWHEDAKNRPIGKKLRLVIVHSTEAYLPMDANQSPFNVGLPLELPEFNRAQVGELARRHGLVWHDEVDALMQWVGGHPYLTRLALYAIARQDLTLPDLLATAPTEAGLYSDHLRQQPALTAAMQTVVRSAEPVAIAAEQAFKLYSIGLIALEGNAVRPRGELYRRYLSERLS